MSADIVTRLRDFAARICSVRGDTNLDNKAVLARAAADEIERLRERVTMLVEAAAEDAERSARLERAITNKEQLL